MARKGAKAQVLALPDNAQRNWVAKHAGDFCQARTFEDRKKADKRGKQKHKGQPWPDQFIVTLAA
ncbi:hypothetical protein ACKC9G_01465 [Pokkaliibacter sp. CJK22405]|uniref:DUF7230 family protein n=1 Tax=Pokkaliibacter sp. CJK22405 TaxID=3384615 RepID=UPI00398505E7